MSYSKRGSKMAIVTVLRPKIAYDISVSEIQHDHRTVCLLLRPTFTDQPIKKLKKNCLPQTLLTSSFTSASFFTTHKKYKCQTLLRHALFVYH